MNHVRPKGWLKYTPACKFEQNEAFCGLTKEEVFKFENWQFTRKAQGAKKSEIEDIFARGEAIYNPNVLETVADEFPKKAWSIQKDTTGTVATLKSHLWPGLYAYHRCNTNISGFLYMGDGIRNDNLPFMV